MTRSNYCEFFRFDGGFCDVFKEGDHYLYAEASPYGWPHMLTCNEWHAPAKSDSGWIRHDASGADSSYLAGLEPAPVDVARGIIRREYARALYYSTRGESCALYGYDEPPTMKECTEDALTNAAQLLDR